MTHEEFKQICLNEYPKIEAMVKTVKALGAEKVSCDVWADGHLNFEIHMPEKVFYSYHTGDSEAGKLCFYFADVERDMEHGRHLENFDWSEPSCFYRSGNDDGVEDDIPVQ